MAIMNMADRATFAPTDLRRALVLGGTADTAPLADGLAARGFQVLVSTFSDAPLDCGNLPGISRRCGPLDAVALADLIAQERITITIDALHPYASLGHATCDKVAAQSKHRFVRLLREGTALPSEAIVVSDHDQALLVIQNDPGPLFCTIGSRYLPAYVQLCRRMQLPILARVLDDPQSLTVCQQAGLREHEVIAARGPFSVQDNLQHMDRIGAGWLLTKDGGLAGGMPAKIAACAQRPCKLLVVGRPAVDHTIPAYASISQLLENL